MTENLVLVHPITGMLKHCYVSNDGTIMFCNFTVRNGQIWRYSKKNKYLPIPMKGRRKKGDNNKLNQKEKEPKLLAVEGSQSL